MIGIKRLPLYIQKIEELSVNGLAIITKMLVMEMLQQIFEKSIFHLLSIKLDLDTIVIFEKFLLVDLTD